MVKRVYTDLAVVDITPQGLTAHNLVPGLDIAELQRLTGLPILGLNR